MRTEQEIRARIARLAKERGIAEHAEDLAEARRIFTAETYLHWALGEESS